MANLENIRTSNILQNEPVVFRIYAYANVITINQIRDHEFERVQGVCMCVYVYGGGVCVWEGCMCVGGFGARKRGDIVIAL